MTPLTQQSRDTLRTACTAAMQHLEAEEPDVFTIAGALMNTARIVAAQLAQGADEPQRIIRAVATMFEVNPAQLASESRLPTVNEARQVACFLLRKRTTEKLETIGKRFNRDHTTVVHAVQHIDRRVMTEGFLAGQISLIEKQLNKAAVATSEEMEIA